MGVSTGRLHAFAVLVSILTAFNAPVTLHAQATNRSAAEMQPARDTELKAAQGALSKVSFLIGEWEGEAWMQTGPGPRATFRQKETIHSVSNNTALLIEGRGSARDSLTGNWREVYQAAGMLTWDAAERRYILVTAGGRGRAMVTEPEIRENGLTWRIEVPGARIRYVITLTSEGRWVENGEVSTDSGVTWNQFLHMNLAKK